MLLAMGFYCGLATLYPYGPVYCPQEDCRGDCRGVYMYSSKSAPLPTTRKLCVGTDPNSTDLNGWFQWKPRVTLPEREQYIGAKVCYWEDRGQPRNINDLERD